jgi:S1-C subfamily serine protease
VAENAEEKGKIFIEWSDPSKSARRKGDPAPAGVAQNEKQPLDETPSPRFSASLADSVVDLIATGATGPWRPNLTREREIHRATGFLVHRGEHFGVLLTAAHLVTQGVPDIVLPGDNKTFPAEVWKTSRAWDLALLRVSERALEDRRPPMELATGSARRGDPGWIVAARQVAARHRPQFLPARRDSPGAEVVRAVGDAYGWTVPRGGWAVYLPQERTFEGYSGAPVLDRDGKVRGMVVGAVDRDDGTQVSVIVEGRILRRFLSQALASDQGSSKSR